MNIPSTILDRTPRGAAAVQRSVQPHRSRRGVLSMCRCPNPSRLLLFQSPPLAIPPLCPMWNGPKPRFLADPLHRTKNPNDLGQIRLFRLNQQKAARAPQAGKCPPRPLHRPLQSLPRQHFQRALELQIALSSTAFTHRRWQDLSTPRACPHRRSPPPQPLKAQLPDRIPCPR